jgi:hypothetical protein
MTSEELSSLAAASKAAYVDYTNAAFAVAQMVDMGQTTERVLPEYREAREAWQKASSLHLAAYEEWRVGAERIRIALTEAVSVDAVREETGAKL